MRKMIGALALAAAVAAPVSASAHIEEVFGNTVLSRYPDGGWVKHWFERDGTYSAEFSDGRRLAARWRVEGERICLNGIRPAFMMISRFCSPIIEANVGETWVSRDPLGRRVTNVLQRGR
ncbi:hypothetical protein ACETK8_09770 [Brevundimonas staleyi]|uniref:Uncharacterized protein n=1 Tax=Brevundimonas staleyi TaxID=74326 RepID=A0ABW0FQM9_9CAUL